PAALTALSPDLGGLAGSSLAIDPGRRPASAGVWTESLLVAARTAPTGTRVRARRRTPALRRPHPPYTSPAELVSSLLIPARAAAPPLPLAATAAAPPSTPPAGAMAADHPTARPAWSPTVGPPPPARDDARSTTPPPPPPPPPTDLFSTAQVGDCVTNAAQV